MPAIAVTTSLSVDEAERQVRQGLADEGFGVLTEIDIAATLRAKLGVERPPMKILGACNPTFAHRALELDEDVAVMLPCNVVVSETPAGTRVSAVDPREMMDSPALDPLADDVAARLSRVLDSLPKR